ncbi:uncharacterized protein LOC143265395 [Megachile rotundata]|uniref:uncharacterized protein LOC143265395 n=1 Tax=Megachile rotundata TaxID=143995 RepID=UPI003FD26581
MAIRVIRGYRTITYAAAMALAGLIPFEMLAAVDALVYTPFRAVRQLNGAPPEPRAVEAFKRQARQLAENRWRRELRRYADKPVVRALLPLLKEWQERSHGRLTYRMTQVLTGHGCFGEYLCRIGKESATACRHCAAPCPAATNRARPLAASSIWGNAGKREKLESGRLLL